jgi:hypothetical protein
VLAARASFGRRPWRYHNRSSPRASFIRAVASVRLNAPPAARSGSAGTRSRGRSAA